MLGLLRLEKLLPSSGRLVLASEAFVRPFLSFSCLRVKMA